MKENRTKTVARYGLLVALAMIMSYLEAQLPVFFAIPGMKLGLTNVVVLVALYGMGYGSAAVIKSCAHRSGQHAVRQRHESGIQSGWRHLKRRGYDAVETHECLQHGCRKHRGRNCA